MRTLVLVFLWLGVAGFGLMTLCSGVFLAMAPAIALPFGLIAAALGWVCWAKARALSRREPPDQDPATPPAQP